MNLYTSYAPPACIQDATHTKSEAKVRRVRCTTEEPAGMGLKTMIGMRRLYPKEK
jgi:hypothetical protein